jgi:hypothetical protein
MDFILQKHIRPLEEFYVQAGKPLPALTALQGSQVPEPQRSLLVHNHDMTPTLENFHQCSITLNALKWVEIGEAILRLVVLRSNQTGKPIEFGAIHIEVPHFPPAAQQQILEHRKPLGGILRDLKVPHTGKPRAYFNIQPDDLILQALELSKSVILYGRLNALYDDQGRVLAEIVEILPP